jgi:hypothetical protein
MVATVGLDVFQPHRYGRVAFGEGLSWSSGVAASTLTVLSVP